MDGLEWCLVRNELPSFGETVLACNLQQRMFLAKVTKSGWKRDNGEMRTDIVAWSYIKRENGLENLLRGE